MVWIWGIVTVFTLILEFVTAYLISIWFAAGGFVTVIATMIWPNLHVVWQGVIFVSTSCLLLFATRPIFKKLTRKDTKTNTEALIGKQIKLGKQENKDVFYHRIADVEWRIVEDTDEELKEGDLVQIIKVRGNKLVVDKVKKNKKGE